jgi:hypothetical protein
MSGCASSQLLYLVGRAAAAQDEPLGQVDRAARGLPVPADVAMYPRQLAAGAVEAGGVTDIYAAAGMERPDLSHLDQAYIERLQQTRNPHLAIESPASPPEPRARYRRSRAQQHRTARR